MNKIQNVLGLYSVPKKTIHIKILSLLLPYTISSGHGSDKILWTI